MVNFDKFRKLKTDNRAIIDSGVNKFESANSWLILVWLQLGSNEIKKNEEGKIYILCANYVQIKKASGVKTLW